MNARSCRELLTEIGPQEQTPEREDMNIWGLLFGAVFSLQQAERMVQRFPDVHFSQTFDQVFDAFLNNFNIDVTEWKDLPIFVPWLSGYYLNSARLRMVFGFENTLFKCNERLVDSGIYPKRENIKLREMLERVKEYEQKKNHPNLYNLVARVENMFAGRDPVKLPIGDLTRLAIDDKEATPERCLYFLHLRVNKFKHNTSRIPLAKSWDEFRNDCVIHRQALSIAVDLWREVRGIAFFGGKK
jgi:hypothetical protein